MTTVAHFYRTVLLPPYLVRAVLVKTLGLDAERANSRAEFATLTMFWRGATRSGCTLCSELVVFSS